MHDVFVIKLPLIVDMCSCLEVELIENLILGVVLDSWPGRHSYGTCKSFMIDRLDSTCTCILFLVQCACMPLSIYLISNVHKLKTSYNCFLCRTTCMYTRTCKYSIVCHMYMYNLYTL